MLAFADLLEERGQLARERRQNACATATFNGAVSYTEYQSVAPTHIELIIELFLPRNTWIRYAYNEETGNWT